MPKLGAPIMLPVANRDDATSDFTAAFEPAVEAGELPDVPGFIVLRRVARGGMGVVYLANDPTFDRLVAIKVMHPGQSAERFVVESQVTARLPHPGVPPVYALGRTADGRPFLAMKLIEGRTLAEELRTVDRLAALPRLLDVFERIGLTVGFAHTRGILHRDLKPANVMLGPFGETLVMDWGLARSIDRSDEPNAIDAHRSSLETVAGQVKGTPAYMAPEQARGELVDARTDVFALGGILATILTGHPPFVGDTVVNTIRKAAAAELEDSFRDLDSCPADPELVALAKRCLAPRPETRFANGVEVADAVAAFRAGVESRLRTAERDRAVSLAEAREQRKRRKVQVGLAAAVIVLLAAAGGFAAWRADRQHAEAKLEGERDAEARRKAEQARQGISANLRLATDLRTKLQFRDAATAIGLAADFARTGAPEESERVETVRRELALAAKLDLIRYRKWIWVPDDKGGGSFNVQRAAADYRDALAGYGFDAKTAPIEESARTLNATGIREELLAAIDDWALHEHRADVRERLLAVNRAADSNPRMSRLREPALWTDSPTVLALAAEPLGPNDSPEAVVLLSELIRRTGRDPAAFLESARQRSPDNFELAVLHYQAEYRANRERTALGPLEAARALRPENPTVWSNLAILYSLDGRPAAAEQACRRAIELDPNTGVFRYNLGLILSPRDREAAAVAYAEGVRVDPNYAPLRNNLGTTLRELGNFDGAIHEFRESIRCNPDEAAPHFNLGASLFIRGDIVAALEAWTAAATLAPNLVDAHFNIGSAHEQLGKPRDALAAYRRCATLDANHAEAHFRIGSISYHLQEFDEAISSLDRALALNPKQAEIHFMRAQCLFRKVEIEAAIAGYRRAVELDANHFQALTNLTVILGLQKKFPEAIRFGRRAVDCEPHNASAHSLLGMICRDAGDIGSARESFRRAAALDPRYRSMEATLPSPTAAPAPREK